MSSVKKISGIEKIRQFLRANVGRVIETKELQKASGDAGQYGRRVRNLREDEGWKIFTHNDDKNLKPGQYRVEEAPAQGSVTIARKISARLRAAVLDRNGFTCQSCGITPGELDPHTNRPARLHIGHIKDKNLGGKDELTNLRALCSTCNQGAKNITTEKPTAVWLLSQVRRAGIDEQQAVYDWLRRKFKEST